MHTLYLFAGFFLGSICGSICGLLLALLLLHARAQSLAEERTSPRAAVPQNEAVAHAEIWVRVPPDPWRYARPSTAISEAAK